MNGNTRLFACDGRFLRWIPTADADERISDGSCEEAFEMRGENPHKIGVQIVDIEDNRKLARIGGGSPASITWGDMQKNVGIASGADDEEVSRACIGAQNKITIWPLVGAKNAAPVMCLWPRQL